MIPMYLQYFTSFISAQVNAIFFYSVVWFLAAISAALIPFTRRDVYESRDRGGKRKGIPVISVLGVVAAALFAYLGYNSIANPAVGPFQTSAQVVVGVVVLIPVAIYCGCRTRYHKRRGVDLRLVQSQIPPE